MSIYLVSNINSPLLVDCRKVSAKICESTHPLIPLTLVVFYYSARLIYVKYQRPVSLS